MNLSKVREDFPVISEGTMDGKRLVYLDSACQSLRPRQVVDAIGGYYNDLGSCTGLFASSNALAARTQVLVSEARVKMARFIGADEPEVIWQPNTTYGMSLVAMSLSSRYCSPGVRMEKGDNIVTTDAEHHSGLLPFWALEREKGVHHRIFPVDSRGEIDLQKFQDFLTRRTKLISVVWASNVTGIINPVEALVKIAHDNGSLVLVDGAQYVPHHLVDVGAFKMDFLAFSVHKMCGPSGTGVLFGVKELLEEMPAVIVGGETVDGLSIANGQSGPTVTPRFRGPPERFEPGLQNFAGIIGAGAAVDYLSSIGMEAVESHEDSLTRLMLSKLAGVDGLEIVGPRTYETGKHAALASFRIRDKEGNLIEGDRIARWMDERVPGHKVLIRSGGHEAHPLLRRLGVPELSTSRASLYLYNEDGDVRLLVDSLKELEESGGGARNLASRKAPA